MIPSLPFARPAYVHRFDVSLNMVFVLMFVFIGRPEPDRQTQFWLLEVSVPVLQSSSVNTISPRRVIYALYSDWSAHCCRTTSVKEMALSKIWYVLYPLGSTAFALNSRFSQIGGSCLTSPRYIPKRLVNVVWSCLLEAFSDHGECFLTGHALLVYEE